MDLRQIFINGCGRLRSGWRLLLFAAVLIVVYIFLGTALWIGHGLLDAILPPITHAAYIADIIGRLNLLLGAVVAAYICNRFVEGLPWRAFGLTFHARWLHDFLIGSVIGIASLSLAVGLATIAGGLRFTLIEAGLRLLVLKTLLASGILFMVAAIAEEAIFRGYPLQTLSRAKLAWLGIVLTSVPFGLVHLKNPNVVPGVTFANTALAGVWLAFAYLRTRSLWFPFGIHWAWNWALGSLFGLPVSGLVLVKQPLLQARDIGPPWLTGGTYGIEGGVACTVALIASSIFIWRTGFVSSTPQLLRMTSEENPAEAAGVLSIRPVDEQNQDSAR